MSEFFSGGRRVAENLPVAKFMKKLAVSSRTQDVAKVCAPWSTKRKPTKKKEPATWWTTVSGWHTAMSFTR